MKRIALAIFLALGGTVTYAQAPSAIKQSAKEAQVDEKALEQRADAITASMVSHLRLSPEQAQEIKGINRSSMKFMEEAKLKYKDNPRKMVQQLDVISETRLSKIKDVLTPQQFQQYQNRREDKMGVPNEAQTNPEANQQRQLFQESY
ncbi:hypothetical protein CLV24_1233 [Pontibacter ummariensis]|uniref:LTXXQ motif family protein n=2 Tax=Pontibacter ummariensis TaxID=1610492 RepID=A0A239JPZ2_9BACT|nr:hypothetical protein CLV24_1233 [Pontibacter ummariensis]SNT07423.1 hypothetical protein SAMN06296052_1233 [Pontibacter ummariensis]